MYISKHLISRSQIFPSADHQRRAMSCDREFPAEMLMAVCFWQHSCWESGIIFPLQWHSNKPGIIDGEPAFSHTQAQKSAHILTEMNICGSFRHTFLTNVILWDLEIVARNLNFGFRQFWCLRFAVQRSKKAGRVTENEGLNQADVKV